MVAGATLGIGAVSALVAQAGRAQSTLVGATCAMAYIADLHAMGAGRTSLCAAVLVALVYVAVAEGAISALVSSTASSTFLVTCVLIQFLVFLVFLVLLVAFAFAGMTVRARTQIEKALGPL